MNMKTYINLLAGGLLTTTLLSGCATALTRSSEAWGEDFKGRPYRATMLDAVMVVQGWGVIDLPFSLVADTAFLPFDLAERAKKE